MRRTILLTLATLAAFACYAEGSSADTALTGPCTPTNTRVLWAQPPAGEDWDGTASGVTEDRDVWTLRACEITLDPVAWKAMTRGERCTLVAHEFGHLYLVRHTASGLMAATSDGQWFEPCRSVRERVERQLATGPHVAVICGKGTRVFYCRTFSGQRVARYRVRVKGSAYTMRRVQT